MLVFYCRNAYANLFCVIIRLNSFYGAIQLNDDLKCYICIWDDGALPEINLKSVRSQISINVIDVIWENPAYGGTVFVLDQPFSIFTFIDYFETVQKAKNMFSSDAHIIMKQKSLCSDQTPRRTRGV